MAKMREALACLYKGENALQRQICLFSICGIAGLINGYMALVEQYYNDATIYLEIGLALLIILFSFFIVGFETEFLHTRKIPDSDINVLKIAAKKVPFIIFLIMIPLCMISVFSKYQYQAFCIETLLAIPLTMIQAGFSYKFENSDAFKLFHKFNAKDYFMLLIKRLWVVIAAYGITLLAVFVIFFIVGLTVALIYKGDVSTISLALSAKQTQIAKLSNYITAILLVYTLTIGVLVWDYELIKTYEAKD